MLQPTKTSWATPRRSAVIVCVVLVAFASLLMLHSMSSPFVFSSSGSSGDSELTASSRQQSNQNNSKRKTNNTSTLRTLSHKKNKQGDNKKFDDAAWERKKRTDKSLWAFGRYGSHHLEPLLTDFARKGLDPSNPYGPMCRLSPDSMFDGGCKSNPYFFPGRRDGHRLVAGVAEMQCSWRRASKKIRETKIQKRNASSSTTTTTDNKKTNKKNLLHKEALREFKRQTSWMFEKWYDWDEDEKLAQRCQDATTAGHNNSTDNNSGGGFIQGGTASSRDRIYTLENFCLGGGMGPLSGFFPPNSSSVSSSSSSGSKNNSSSAPTVARWTGTNEAFSVNGGLRGVDRGMSPVLHNIERLSERPKCFLPLDKLVIFPISIHGSNAGHVIHRMASLMRLIEIAFFGGRRSRGADKNTTRRNDFSDVTVLYLVTPAGMGFTSTPEANEKLNALRYFYDALGTQWISAFAEDVPLVREAWKSYLPPSSSKLGAWNSSSSSASSPRTCFRKAIIWNNADLQHVMNEKTKPAAQRDRLLLSQKITNSSSNTKKQQQQVRQKEKGDFIANASKYGSRHSFHLFGPRSSRDVDTLNMLNERLRQCSSFSSLSSSSEFHKNNSNHHQTQNQQLRPRRTIASYKNPHVIFSGRSVHRRFALQPFLVNVIASYVQNKLNGTFEVLEHIAGLNFDEVIDRFSRADVLISIHGAALVWLQFMPPGAIIVEINCPFYRCAERPGINVNRECDFGGSAVAAQQWHVAIANNYAPLMRFPMYIEKGRRHGGSHSDVAGGGVYMRWILHRVVRCLLEKNHTNTTIMSPSSFSFSSPTSAKECQFSAQELYNISRLDVTDVSGENLAAFVQMQLLPFSARRHNNNNNNLTHHEEQMSNKDKKNNKSSLSSSSSVSFSLARMRLMIQHRAALSKWIRPFRSVAAGSREVFFRVMFVVSVPCDEFLRIGGGGKKADHSLHQQEENNRDMLLREINAWRGILRDVNDVTVACARAKTAVDYDNNNNSTRNNNKNSTNHTAASVVPRRPQLITLQHINNTSDSLAWHGIGFCAYPCGVDALVRGRSPLNETDKFHIIIRSSVSSSSNTSNHSSGLDDDGGNVLMQRFLRRASPKQGRLFTFHHHHDGDILQRRKTNSDDDHDDIDEGFILVHEHINNRTNVSRQRAKWSQHNTAGRGAAMVSRGGNNPFHRLRKAGSASLFWAGGASRGVRKRAKNNTTRSSSSPAQKSSNHRQHISMQEGTEKGEQHHDDELADTDDYDDDDDDEALTTTSQPRAVGSRSDLVGEFQNFLRNMKD